MPQIMAGALMADAVIRRFEQALEAFVSLIDQETQRQAAEAASEAEGYVLN